MSRSIRHYILSRPLHYPRTTSETWKEKQFIFLPRVLVSDSRPKLPLHLIFFLSFLKHLFFAIGFPSLSVQGKCLVIQPGRVRRPRGQYRRLSRGPTKTPGLRSSPTDTNPLARFRPTLSTVWNSPVVKTPAFHFKEMLIIIIIIKRRVSIFSPFLFFGVLDRDGNRREER